MSKKPDAGTNSAIQFRAPPSFLGAVDGFAESWGLTRNETAKRLAALAAHGMDERHHEMVAKLTDRMYGSQDFADTCEKIKIALRAFEAGARKNMEEDERQSVIRQFVEFELQLHTKFRDQEPDNRIRIGVLRHPPSQ